MRRPTSDPGPDEDDRQDDELETPDADEDDTAGLLRWLRRGILVERGS